jgi:hypothetical protein
MYPSRRTLALAAAALIAAGGAVACGSDDSTSPATTGVAPTSASSTVVASTAPTTTSAAAPTTAAPTTAAPTTPAPTTAVPATSTVPVAEPGPLDIVTRDYAFQGMPAVLRAGTYQVSVHNEGAELHEFVVYRPTDGKTLEELAAIGPEGFLEHAELAAYIPGVAPGEVLPTDMVLQPGEWTLVCFIPALHDQQPHFAHGMRQTITVVP